MGDLCAFPSEHSSVLSVLNELSCAHSSGEVEVSALWLLYLENSGKACVISWKATSASAQRHHGAASLPRSIPRSQPASAAFTGKTKMSGFGEGRPVHSPFLQYQGRFTALDFLARLQLCTSGPDISFAG